MFFGNQEFLGIFSVADTGTDFKVGNFLHIVEAKLMRVAATVLERLTTDASMDIAFKREDADGNVHNLGASLTIDSTVEKGDQACIFSWTGWSLYDGDVLIVSIATTGEPVAGKVALWASFAARR